MINISVCGKFHYPKYLKYLVELGFLNKFYCSYKIGSNFGVPNEKIENAYLKEYLMYFHLYTAGEYGLAQMMPIYHDIWQKKIESNFEPAALNHFMLHGNCTRLINSCNNKNTITIGEAVNAHPITQQNILQSEALKRGIYHQSNLKITNRMLEEIDAIDYLLVASQFVKNSYLDNGFEEKKIISLPYGVDPGLNSTSHPITDKESSSKKTIKIVCVGQIMPRKGQYYLVEAIKLLNQTSQDLIYSLTLIGRPDSRYMTCLRKLYADFEHINHIDNKDMIDFMSKFDMFVLPSLEDGFSVVVCEALSANLPVVTTRNNGAADIIETGRNGIVINAGDTLEIKRAIEEVLDSQFEAKEIKLQSWNEYAVALKSNYKNILKNKEL